MKDMHKTNCEAYLLATRTSFESFQQSISPPSIFDTDLQSYEQVVGLDPQCNFRIVSVPMPESQSDRRWMDAVT